MRYLLENSVFFDGQITPMLIAALVVLIAVCASCYLRIRKLKKERNALRAALEVKEKT